MAMGTVAANLLALAVSATPTVYMNGHLPSAADSQAMHDLGAAGVRMDFNWYDFEPQQGAWNWQYLDDVVNAARAQGLSIFATVAYTPDWASSRAGCVPHSPDDTLKCDNTVPANVQDWKNAVTAVVTRYKGKVDCWGIWNEPNLGTFFQGTMDDYVSSIFVPAEAAIRAADPQARVCGPELSGLTGSSSWNGKNGQCVFGGCIRNGWELDLGGLLDRIGPKLDVVTQHFYKGDAAGVVGAMLDGETSFGVLTHDSLKHVLELHGAGTKEVWLTETGWEHGPQGSMAEADVATRIVDLYGKQEEVCGGAYAASLNDPWKNWTRTYYFHFPYDPGSGWGIVGPSEAPLAPYSALQNWTNGKSTTACGLPGTGGGTGGGAGGGAGGGTGGGSGGSSGGGAGGGAAGGLGGGSGGGATGGSGGTGAGGDPGTGGSGGSGTGGAGAGGSGGSAGTGGSSTGTGGSNAGTGGGAGGSTGTGGASSTSGAGGEAPIAAAPGSGCAAVPGPLVVGVALILAGLIRRRRTPRSLG